MNNNDETLRQLAGQLNIDAGHVDELVDDIRQGDALLNQLGSVAPDPVLRDRIAQLAQQQCQPRRAQRLPSRRFLAWSYRAAAVLLLALGLVAYWSTRSPAPSTELPTNITAAFVDDDSALWDAVLSAERDMENLDELTDDITLTEVLWFYETEQEQTDDLFGKENNHESLTYNSATVHNRHSA